jgi:23S rRNA pseudouridine2605 synthase
MHSTTNDSKILLALNKPKGCLVTRSDDLGRKTVYKLLPDWAFDEGWMPIGRLDLESKGLLLFTTEGKVGNLLTKPGGCMIVYEMWVRGHVTEEHIAQAV